MLTIGREYTRVLNDVYRSVKDKKVEGAREEGAGLGRRFMQRIRVQGIVDSNQVTRIITDPLALFGGFGISKK